LHTVIDMVIVNVHLPTGKPLPISDDIRAYLDTLPTA
jgi:acyl-CoA thioester hydrolase